MKKIAIIIGTLLLLIFVIMCTIYTVRKNSIESQYVSKSSASILSFAVDDLLIDNVPNLISWKNTPKSTYRQENWVKKIIFNAGISIPARIHLFTFAPEKTRFYGILAVKNYDKCFSFFAEHFPDKVNFVNKENGTVIVDINKHLKILFNRNNLIYKIAPEQSTDYKDLQSLLSKPSDWISIGSLEGFEHALSNKHICYVQKDKSLKIEATVTKNKIEMDGEWLLSQNLVDTFKVRAMNTNNQTLTFWSLLPLKEVPALSYLMSKYTGLNREVLNRNYSNYFDLQLKTEPVIQRDSSISYVYDDDFNRVEKIQVKNLEVPNIVHTWKYSKSLNESLPNKMFYTFNKKQIEQYLINTTSNTFPNQVKYKETIHPLYCFIDFGTWPETWNVSLFKKLKKDKVNATITTTLQNKRTLSIKGQINY